MLTISSILFFPPPPPPPTSLTINSLPLSMGGGVSYGGKFIAQYIYEQKFHSINSKNLEPIFIQTPPARSQIWHQTERKGAFCSRPFGFCPILRESRAPPQPPVAEAFSHFNKLRSRVIQTRLDAHQINDVAQHSLFLFFTLSLFLTPLMTGRNGSKVSKVLPGI